MSIVSYDYALLETLRTSVGEWSKEHFDRSLPPDGSSFGMLRCAAGMAEELSELICGRDKQEYLDAVADICIYGLDLCYRAGFGMRDMLTCDDETSIWENHGSPFLSSTVLQVQITNLSVHIGKICHGCLKRSQGIRGTEDHLADIKINMKHVWGLCRSVCAGVGEDLNRVVYNTACSVIKRDWTKNPDGAHEETT